jgi:pimeloyl-ACP methyl ester carboxylesterase
VLLHGWALDRRAWAPQRPLADHFRLIAIDRRGFGRSTAPPDLAAEIGDLERLCDRLGLERAILVGMSQGGRIALHFALAHPERVAGLVLQGAPLDGFQPDARGADIIPLGAYRALARKGRLDEMKALWRAHPIMRDAGPALDPLLADYEGRDLIAPEVAMPPIAGALGGIGAPALALTGEDDLPWRQLVADSIAYALPGGVRARVPGGHLCNLSHSGPYNGLVASFAAGIAA